ncbi:hypothetical protein BGZ61DRAFT_437405, partial [Ilyonectria robusta]|uniref:uncharacterized protein n=1 Tax=Ilyonectria robusta TaxID=1079257 RepID=UPI001E8D659B
STIHHPPSTIQEAQPVSAQGPGPILHPLLAALPVRARVAVAFAHQAKPMTSGMHMHVRPLTRRKQDFPPARRRELGSAEQNHHCKTAQRRPSQSSRGPARQWVGLTPSPPLCDLGQSCAAPLHPGPWGLRLGVVSVAGLGQSRWETGQGSN